MVILMYRCWLCVFVHGLVHGQLQREVQVLEFEKLQVKDLLAQGYPPQELVRMGMTLEPSVLNP